MWRWTRQIILLRVDQAIVAEDRPLKNKFLNAFSLFNKTSENNPFWCIILIKKCENISRCNRIDIFRATILGQAYCVAAKSRL